MWECQFIKTKNYEANGILNIDEIFYTINLIVY